MYPEAVQRRWLIICSIAVMALLTFAVVREITNLDDALQTRLSQGWFLPPTEFYSVGLHCCVIGSEVQMDKGGEVASRSP